MRKSLKFYLIIWAVLVVLFNVVAFVTPTTIAGISKYEGGFWPGYGFVMAAFVVHLIYIWRLLTVTESVERSGKNGPAMTVSSVELLVMIVIGLICMLAPGVARWVGIIICSIIFALSVIVLVITTLTEENKYNTNCEEK